MDLISKIEMISNALEDRKGYDIKKLDVRNVSPMCDAFVIVSGNNKNQLQALCDAVEEVCSDNDIKLKEREGRAESGWILLDYSDIIVHIFSSEMREFYNLDHTWKDASIIA
ncbi:ribosome silencing factor [Eubacterium ruminantium]|uniref:ribosome silencing factor n=1 Tax=Eubacterium ruminantium TaxID=42322 RepID=UPI0015694C93|nr:ribosome silencing factor [Eubacterium ruminantium]